MSMRRFDVEHLSVFERPHYSGARLSFHREKAKMVTQETVMLKRLLHIVLIAAVFAPAAVGQAQDTPKIFPISPTGPKQQVKSEPVNDPLQPPDLSDQSTALQRAAEDEELLRQAANSDQAALLARIRKSLVTPDPIAEGQAVKKQLDQLIDDTGRLAAITEPGPLQLQSLSLQMQSLYTRITRWPDDPKVDRMLFRLRAAARRAKTLDQPQAGAIADFWLLTADLFDINRLNLPPDQRRKQTQQLFDEYLVAHGAGPTSDAVRTMLTRLNQSAPKPEPKPTDAPKPDDKPMANEAAPESSGGANTAVEIPAEPAPSPQDQPGVKPEPQGDQPVIPPAYQLGEKTEVDGETRYTLRSRYQPGENLLRVLTPDQKQGDASRLRVLFVLPVEPGLSDQFGDGLATVKRLDLHNKHNLIVVAPTFSQLPWYANHPNNADLQQESYMAKAIVPAVDELFPGAKHRMLLGFSKSGWGAVSLAIRYMELFDAAAAWDAPLMKLKPDNYGMGPIFGTQQNFNLYALPTELRDKARHLRRDKRLVLMGYDHFQEDMQRAHTLLDQLDIPHIYKDGPQRRHHWDSGWIPAAVDELVKLIEPSDDDKTPDQSKPTESSD